MFSNMKVDLETWKYVKENYADEIEERKLVAEEEKKKEDQIQKITVFYGNKYTELKEFKTTRGGYEIKHKWTVYARLLNDKVQPSSIIKSVEFELDDSYG